jgi:hypothetical protein
LEGGKAVLRARNLYNLYEQTFYDDSLACDTGSERNFKRQTPLQSLDLSIRPNPSSGLLNIVCNSKTYIGQSLKVVLFDVSGVSVFSQTINATGYDTVRLDKLPNGIYEVKITASDGLSQTTKLVLAR